MTEPQNIKQLHNQLVKSTFHEFPIKGKIQASTKQGVYIVYDDLLRPLHVGKTNGAKNGLNDRLQNHVWNQSHQIRLNDLCHSLQKRESGK